MSRFLRRAMAPRQQQSQDADALAPGKALDHDTGSASGSSSRAPSIAPTKDLLLYPSSACSVPADVALTAEQERIESSVKTHLLELHGHLAQSDASYVPWERRWIEDPSTARRYARAVKYDEASAKRRAAETLEWRREFKPDLIIPGEVRREGETGKHIVSGFDKAARPILYLRPGRENTEPNPQQIRFLVFDLERAIGELRVRAGGRAGACGSEHEQKRLRCRIIDGSCFLLDKVYTAHTSPASPSLDLCPPGQDKICLLIDYSTATQHTQPSFATQRKVLSILQNHYPERLGHAIVVNVPWFLSTFFAAISPFLDPNTRTKISMLRSPDNVKDTIPLDMLDADFGGLWRYDFQFDKYWDDLLVRERRRGRGREWPNVWGYEADIFDSWIHSHARVDRTSAGWRTMGPAHTKHERGHRPRMPPEEQCRHKRYRPKRTTPAWPRIRAM